MNAVQATSRRLAEIRDLVRSGLTEHTGRAKRTAKEEGWEATGQRFAGLKPSYPELERISDSPGAIAEAIERGKGPAYERVSKVVYDAMLRAGYPEPRKRSPGKPVIPPHEGRSYCEACKVAHSKGQHRFHGKGSYHATHLFSFGGEGVKNPKHVRWFIRKMEAETWIKRMRKKGIYGSHPRSERGLYRVDILTQRKSNPGKAVRIYGRVIRVIAQKTGPHGNCDAECKRCNHEYFHDFKKGAVMYGLPDGSLLIKKG